MVLWMTTIILPSFLETNCLAKPHSYRLVCSENSTKISQKLFTGDIPFLYLTAIAWCSTVLQGGDCGMSQLQLAQVSCRRSTSSSPSQWVVGLSMAADIYQSPPSNCIQERSASASFWSLAPGSPKTPHCCILVALVQPPNVISCTQLSNH